MSKDHKNYVHELESKVQILERENIFLSSKAEENLLLNRAFTEINSIESIPEILTHSLESISILLNIPYAGIFDYEKGRFVCKQSYASFLSEDTTEVAISSGTPGPGILFPRKPVSYLADEIKLEFRDPEIHFRSRVCFLVPQETKMYSKRIFAFATDDTDNLDDDKRDVLNKIIDILTARMERFTYQEELKDMYKEIKVTNEKLLKTNKELNEAMDLLKATEAQLVHSEKMASLGILTAGVAHEINNPLNFINAGCQYIKGYLEKLECVEDNPNVKKSLLAIEQGIERASSIIKEMNQFSAKSLVNNDTCDIHSTLDNCIQVLHHMTSPRVEIIKDYHNSHLYVKGNEGNLHQVFLNILTNSIQSIKDKGTIRISTYRKTNAVVISITDSGCGIKKKYLPKVTDPFFTTKDPGFGKGLGLSITLSIIENLKGTFEISSEPDKGTSVNVSFPTYRE